MDSQAYALNKKCKDAAKMQKEAGLKTTIAYVIVFLPRISSFDKAYRISSMGFEYDFANQLVWGNLFLGGINLSMLLHNALLFLEYMDG